MTFFDDDNNGFVPDIPEDEFIPDFESDDSEKIPDFDTDFEGNPLSEEPDVQEDDEDLKDVSRILEKLRKQRENDDIELSKNSTVVTERLNPDEATNSKDLAKIFSPEATKIPVVNNVENAVTFVKEQKSKEETVYLYEDKPSEKMQEDAKQGKESIWQAMSRLDVTEGEEGVKTVKVRGTEEEENTAEKQMPEKKEYPEVRKYTNKIKKDQIVFAKPKELETGGWKKVVIFLIACLAVGLFLGLKANAYSIANAGKASNFECVYKWLENDVPFRLNPFNQNVFMTGFGVGAGGLGLVGLFTWLDNDAKKQSRVGHEHGNARLGTPSDFKKFRNKFMEQNDNNMLFGVYRGQELGLSLNNKKVNRSANVLVIGGTGTGKTFKYIKPNLLQENASVIVTDPSGDIFRSFAPYLLSKGYNVYLFNASDFGMSNHYNPLMNVFDSNGEISENQVNILVDLYMKNAKAGKEAGGGDPFWDKSEKAFMTALIYYVLENDAILPKDKCFATVLQKVQMAKVSDDNKGMSPLTREMYDWFVRVGIMTYKGGDKPPAEDAAWESVKEQDYKETFAQTKYKTKLYYDTFKVAPEKTANTIVITTAVDLQIFATKQVDFITRTDYQYPENNIDIDTIATQQSYLFLGIPQSHQAYNFLIAMLYSQLYGRLYELGERKIRGKWHIGYKFGTPVFAYCDSEEEAKDFYEHVTKDCIVHKDYMNGTKMYSIAYKGKEYKHSVLKEPLEKFIDEIDKMYIWNGDDFAGGDPSLPIHINFLLDEFKNIGEIPNFLTILSTSRKYRIGSHVVIQDIGQLKTLYKDGEHETVMANVDTTVFLGSILKEDKEEIQKMLGKTTIRQKSTSSSNSGLSTSYTPTEVDLMSLDEISAINQDGRDDELVIIRDVTPYLCRKLNLTEHKRWKDVKAVKDLHIDAPRYYRNDVEEGYYKN